MWFLSYAPYLFLQDSYDTLSFGTKIFSSLCANTAMAYGFQLMLMFEGTGEGTRFEDFQKFPLFGCFSSTGIQWSNIFKTNTPDDDLTLGLIILMLFIDTIIYLLVALYVEAIFPGEYGVPQPWYFPFTCTYWLGHPLDTSRYNKIVIFVVARFILYHLLKVLKISKVFQGMKVNFSNRIRKHCTPVFKYGIYVKCLKRKRPCGIYR